MSVISNLIKAKQILNLSDDEFDEIKLAIEQMNAKKHKLKTIDEIEHYMLYKDALLRFSDHHKKIFDAIYFLATIQFANFGDYKKFNEFLLSAVSQTQSILDNYEALFQNPDNTKGRY